MIRYSLLTLFITFVCVYSFRDWYRALCVLIPLLALVERPDMPRTMLGMPGLNPFNIALLFIMLGYVLDNHKPSLPKLPGWMGFLLVSYLVIFIISFSRMFLDLEGLYKLSDYLNQPYPGTATLIFEHVLDPLRFVIPGIILATGINSKDRLNWALYSILAMGGLFSLQIISKMAPALWGADDLASRAVRVLSRDTGYHRVESATILGMIVPAFLVLFMCARNFLERLAATGGGIICTLGLLLTGGRAGMLGAAIACAILAFYKSKKLLLALVLLVPIAIPAVPGLQERLVEGFGAEENQQRERHEELGLIDEEGRNIYAITSGRAAVWPSVLEKIGEAPLVGHGKNAMPREGITLSLTDILGSGGIDFGHPHNAYLDLLLDAGILGAVPILLFYFLTGISAKRTFVRATDVNITLVAGALFGFLISFSVSAMGSGAFWPELRAVTLWCLFGIYVGVKYGLPFAEEERSQEEAPAVDPPGGLWTKVRSGHAWG